MATNSWTTSVRVLPSENISVNFELFSHAGFRQALLDRLDITDAELAERLDDGGISDLSFDILISNSRVSINNQTYQDPFDGTIISSGDYVRRRINSIRIEDSGIGCDILFGIL